MIGLAVHYLDPTGKPHIASIAGQHLIRRALHEKFLYSSAFRRAARNATLTGCRCE